jgi:hypothetical protein
MNRPNPLFGLNEFDWVDWVYPTHVHSYLKQGMKTEMKIILNGGKLCGKILPTHFPILLTSLIMKNQN